MNLLQGLTNQLSVQISPWREILKPLKKCYESLLSHAEDFPKPEAIQDICPTLDNTHC